MVITKFEIKVLYIYNYKIIIIIFRLIENMYLTFVKNILVKLNLRKSSKQTKSKPTLQGCVWLLLHYYLT